MVIYFTAACQSRPSNVSRYKVMCQVFAVLVLVSLHFGMMRARARTRARVSVLERQRVLSGVCRCAENGKYDR